MSIQKYVASNLYATEREGDLVVVLLSDHRKALEEAYYEGWVDGQEYDPPPFKEALAAFLAQQEKEGT